MAGLSLMQTRTFIDRLGDLEEEITKVCRASEIIAKNAGKEHASGVGRLKEACDALKDKQQYLREAKDCLLEFDGFLHAEAGTMREAMAHPRVGSMFGRIGERMEPMMAMHVNAMVDETVDGIRRVTSAVKALRDAKEDAKRSGSLKESAKALSKVCSAAEKAISKAVKMSVEPPAPEPMPEEAVMDEEVVVEKAAGTVGFHGYNLTAGLPPEFLENAQKKKDEAKGKKDDDKDDEKKADKKADSQVPGNESKGPKELGEEDMGWVPGHRTTQKPKDEDDEKKGGKKKADSKDPDPSMEEDLPGEDTDGEPVVDKSAHGYQLTEPSDHGYDLTA